MQEKAVFVRSFSATFGSRHDAWERRRIAMSNLDSSAGLALASQRHLFEIPDDVAFLNCAYISPLPRASLFAGDRGLRRKAQPWTVAADFFTTSETVRRLFADLINADADDVAFAPAVSYGMAQAAHNIPIRRTQRIVTLSEQFPSNVYPWMDLAERSGAAFVSVPRPGDDDWTSALLSFIDRSTGIVAVPQCHWTDGGLIDLEAIAAACRRVGAALCVDATQSVGALPFDVKRIDPDFVGVASYKWLLGPYSLGFLYVAPRWQRGRPIEHNWIAREGSEDFAGLVNYSHDFQSGAPIRRRRAQQLRADAGGRSLAQADLAMDGAAHLRDAAAAHARHRRARAPNSASPACRPSAVRVTIWDCAFAAECRPICPSALPRPMSMSPSAVRPCA
jgi:selenocysteine lyase/cysteine desulfurase